MGLFRCVILDESGSGEMMLVSSSCARVNLVMGEIGAGNPMTKLWLNFFFLHPRLILTNVLQV